MPVCRPLRNVCVAAALLGGTMAGVAGCPSSTPPGTPPGKTAAAPAGYGGAAKAPFDPVNENGPIFEDWPKPAYSFVITGGQFGYLEPCGCTAGQVGGRHTSPSQVGRPRSGAPRRAAPTLAAPWTFVKT